MSNSCIQTAHKHWQKLTLQANSLFNNKDYEEALVLYKRTLYHAEMLEKYGAQCIELEIPFVQMYVISCNNLANTCEELQQYNDSVQYLQRSLKYLIRLSGNKDLDREEIRQEAHKAAILCMSFQQKMEENDRLGQAVISPAMADLQFNGRPGDLN